VRRFTFKNDKNKTNVFASAALVGAIREHFTGIEGSQGPYKLRDKWQLYVLVISGSERVYVNGLLLKEEKITITPSTTMLVKLHSSPLYDKLRNAELQ
jgi:hypothetical protein